MGLPNRPTLTLCCALGLAATGSLENLAREVAPAASVEGPAIRFQGSPRERRFGTVSVIGLAPEALEELRRRELDRTDWRELFPVFTGERCPERGELPPILGSYEIADGAILFRPRFPLAAGLAYCARFEAGLLDTRDGSPARSNLRLELVFSMPEAADSSRTLVEAVYPSGPEVPENLLRLYIHFSAPMLPKDVHEFVRLFDAAGNEVPLPFVEVRQGLWDPSARRLTLFLHPGRIKRGVGPNLALGPPLKAGESYRLVIDRQMLDASGVPLAAGFERQLRVEQADRRSPDPREWRLTPPPAGGREPLVVHFREALDHALLLRMIRVVSERAGDIDGTVSVSEHESRWSFIPHRVWQPGDYTLVVHPALEDLAGNGLDHLFEERLVRGRADRQPTGDRLPGVHFLIQP